MTDWNEYEKQINRYKEDLHSCAKELDWYARREETNHAELTEIIKMIENARVGDLHEVINEIKERLTNMRDALAV